MYILIILENKQLHTIEKQNKIQLECKGIENIKKKCCYHSKINIYPSALLTGTLFF